MKTITILALLLLSTGCATSAKFPEFHVATDGQVTTTSEHDLIPEGFMSDGGSVPRPLSWINSWLHPTGRGLPAYMMHDYRLHIRDHSTPSWRLPRKVIDQQLRFDLEELGCPSLVSWPVFWSVRLFSITISKEG